MGRDTTLLRIFAFATHAAAVAEEAVAGGRSPAAKARGVGGESGVLRRGTQV